MIEKAIGKMRPGKAADPSGITVEMLKAMGSESVEMIRQVGERIFNGILSLLNGKKASS